MFGMWEMVKECFKVYCDVGIIMFKFGLDVVEFGKLCFELFENIVDFVKEIL